MNRDNNTMLTSPNLSYTSRDFTSIYDELLKSIPILTKDWDPKDENDPGLVLLKLIAMTGDMLSYNQDKQALEAFPRTVLQRANAQQIFRLIGYKMHWYRSAIVEARFTNANSFAVNVGRYNTFATNDGSIMYTNLKEFSIPAGAYGVNSYKHELIQGTPVTPIMKGGAKPSDYNAAWHESYDYNVLASDIVNNTLYLKYENIDETSISLIDNDETPFAINEWKLVKNINLSETMDKVFEFDVDEDGTPFIILPNYWNEKYVITKFKLFYVLSNGKDGEIEENKLSIINSSKCYVDNDNLSIGTALEGVEIFNTPSTYGYAAETCTEARKEAEKYQNTIDTLVVLKDFEKATRRIDSVANVIATDIETDPHGDEMSNNQVRLWVIRKSDYNNSGENYIYTQTHLDDTNNDEIFKENVIGELKSYKLMPYDIDIYLENKIDWINWTISGQIFLRKPINADQNVDLMSRIDQNLKARFNTETLDFNEAVNYMDVIECIMKTDKNIWHVDLDTASVEYDKVKRNIKGNETGLQIKNKYMINLPDGQYSGYYMTSLGCTSIEINKILPYITTTDPDTGKTIVKDEYKYIYDGIDIPGYLPTNDSQDISQTTNVLTDGSVTPAGSGFNKNVGNKIVREDGLETVIGLDFGRPDEPREYEIYNKMIFDWTGYEPVFTGRIIDTSTNPFRILKYNDNGVLEDTGYTLDFDSRMYMEDGSDANRYFKANYKQIEQLCPNIDKVYTDKELNEMTIEEKDQLVNEGKLRSVFDVIDRQYDSWTGESVDRLTGEIFVLRGKYWYSTHRCYDESTGYILDTNGTIQYYNDSSIMREPACREDITQEYVYNLEIGNNKTEFDFYLGQSGSLNDDSVIVERVKNSIGNYIEGYPIKPSSLFIYINDDVNIIADTGTGKLLGTPGLINGFGTVDYNTGRVTFKLNTEANNIKILYRVNKFTYSVYRTFDVNKFFVRPEYIRSDTRK